LVLSDLHLELGTSYTLPQGLEFDMVVLAGDIQAPGRKAVIWAQRQSVFAGKPVVLVPGNHEYYGAPSLHCELEAMRELAAGSKVHVLDRDVAIIDGVRFVGCTLWTDFQLPIRLPLGQDVAGEPGPPDTDITVALAEANRRIDDFKLIQVIEPVSRQNRYREFKRPLRAEEAIAMHWVDRDWLRRTLKEPFDGPTVVVTHHAPSPLSVDPKYDGDRLTPAFASNLPEDFFDIPDLWIHGHTHFSARYSRGAHGFCEVVSNPRGYRMKDGTFENTAFNSGLVIDARTLRW
jgi:predicted phosphodiesterase